MRRARRRDALGIEPVRARARREALHGVQPEDVAHYLRLVLVHDASASHITALSVDDRLTAVAEGTAASGAAPAHGACHAPVRLRAEVVDEQLVLEPDDRRHDTAAVVGEVGPRCDRENFDAVEPQPLDCVVHLRLVAP